MAAGDILKEVLLTIGLETDDPQVTSRDFGVQQTVEFINQSGRDLVERARWPKLFKEFETTATRDADRPSRATIALSQMQVDEISTVDYVALEESTARSPTDALVARRSRLYCRRIPASIVSSIEAVDETSSSAVPHYVVRRRHIDIYGYNNSDFNGFEDDSPVFVGIHSKNWVSNDSNRILTNTNEILIPERLVAEGAVWRYRRSRGLPYIDYVQEFEHNLREEYHRETGTYPDARPSAAS